MLCPPHHLSATTSDGRCCAAEAWFYSSDQSFSVCGGWFVGSLRLCSFRRDLFCSWWLVCRSPAVFKVGLWCLVFSGGGGAMCPQLSTTVTVLLFRRCGFGCSERIHLLFVWLLAAAVRFSVCVWCSVFLFCGSVVSFVASFLWIWWFFCVSVLLPVLCVVFRFLSRVCFLLC